MYYLDGYDMAYLDLYHAVIMSTVASQITSISTICWTICPVANQRKHKSPALLAFVKGIHRWPVGNAENVSI